MLLLRKPSNEKISCFLKAEAKRALTYSAVGATANSPPANHTVDHTRIQLGAGEHVFRTAKAALQRWEQFHLGWVETFPGDTPIQANEVVAILANSMGGWWLNSCRIVYVVDDSGTSTRFGFAYGTLPGHVESGEERFLIEWNHDNDQVWYDILAFSRPNHILVRLGYPLVRCLQKRFARNSAEAMQKVIRDSLPIDSSS